jgi:hypothetical protein
MRFIPAAFPASPLRQLAWLILASAALAPGAMAGGVVFSNITATDCDCGVGGGGYLLEQFTPGANADLVDVAARLQNDGPSFVETFAVLSDTGGAPGTILTQLSATVPAGSWESRVEGVFTSGAPSVPLTLLAGTPYWLEVWAPDSASWEGYGSQDAPYAYSTSALADGPFADFGSCGLQFEVDGTPSAATPEPGAFSLALLGLAVLAVVKRRFSLARSR